MLLSLHQINKKHQISKKRGASKTELRLQQHRSGIASVYKQGVWTEKTQVQISTHLLISHVTLSR